MKKIFGSICLAAVLFTSCKQDFLEDMKSYDKFDENLFKSQAQTDWYIDRLYYDYFSAYKSPIVNLVGVYNDSRTKMTEEIGGTISNYIDPQKTLVNAVDADSYFGAPLSASLVNNPYTRIRNCNVLLEKIETIGKDLPLSYRKTSRGQMYFLRALQYFDLVRVYGGVPIITAVQDTKDASEAIQIPRAKSSEVFAQIVKDLDSAAALLPMVWSGSGDYGRFTGAASLAMKSRVLLTAASPLFNTKWDDPSDVKWQAALDAGLAAETALTNAGYGLYGSGSTKGKDWAEMWYKNDNSFNKEAIMVQLLTNSTLTTGTNLNGWEKSIRVTKQKGSGGISAPKEMINLFPLADGSRPTVTNGYDELNFFMNRDPRFYRTFAFSGSKWPIADADVTPVIWLYRWKNGNNPLYSDGNSFSSPAVVCKMTTPKASYVTGLDRTGTDIMEYRYAELLLNIAECYAAKGDIANCITYLGRIRNRVGIPSANNYGIGTLPDKYAAIEACLYERRIELAYEGKRFWDIQRWMLYNDDAAAGNNTCTKLGISPINGTARTGQLWQYKTTAGKDDPLLTARGTISIDPDAADFQTQLQALKAFVEANIVLSAPDKPMDNVNGTAVSINFRQNYYLSGIKSDVLSVNPWLKQTIGWNDYSGGAGTFDFKQ
jgi:starch-binding outer membrane protein, SusD/RagB family